MTKKLITVCGLLLACSVVAHAQSPVTPTVSRSLLYSSLALDIATTERVMKLGGRELNPIAGQNPYRRNAVAIGNTVVVDLATRYLRKKGHAKLAAVMTFAAAGLHFGAAWHNHKVFKDYYR